MWIPQSSEIREAGKQVHLVLQVQNELKTMQDFNWWVSIDQLTTYDINLSTGQNIAHIIRIVLP